MAESPLTSNRLSQSELAGMTGIGIASLGTIFELAKLLDVEPIKFSFSGG